MMYMLKKIPQELRRLAVIGIVAGVVATAVIYSRGEHTAPEDVWLGSMQAFQQPKDRQQAEGWFAPTQSKDRPQAEGWFAPTQPFLQIVITQSKIQEDVFGGFKSGT